MTDFKPGDIVEWIHPNGDKSTCTVSEIENNERMWVVWHKDNFVNIMPKKGFILAEERE